ncbi:hypothetical protein SteCoe_36815 [Stentor coeruleus]|uniref:Uncharacterized protein n=1 Tax=Stentor coeruleus TaxID=5963 RepID=A0A1R2APD9_9CILI|nr:hypothetical protein SteCoe_36815 [Stentor coeruleus]
MSRFFLNIPREKAFDSVSSISFKSTMLTTSDTRFSQGLLLLSSIFKSKTQKKAAFISWKNCTQTSFYSLWKEIIKEGSCLQEFEVILKLVQKRKEEVDNMWAMIKTQEQKYLDLLKQNEILEEKNKNLQIQEVETNEKSTQVNFLQDSLLRRAHKELELYEKSLISKENQLKNFENFLSEKFDSLLIREKSFYQKQVGTLILPKLNSEDELYEYTENFKSSIFTELIEDNLWLQLLEPPSVTFDQLKQLKEFEKALFVKNSELASKKSQLEADIAWVEAAKLELIEREAKLAGLEELQIEVEKEKQDVKSRYEEILQISDELEMQIKATEKTRYKQQTDWDLDIEGIEDSEDVAEYLTYGLEELNELQKQGTQDSGLNDVLIDNIIRFGESLILREKHMKKIFVAKTAYLDSQKQEIEELRKMIKIEESLLKEVKYLESTNAEKRIEGINIDNFQSYQEVILSNHVFLINEVISDISQEEVDIKKIQLENEIAIYNKLNENLHKEIKNYENKVDEFLVIGQLLGEVRNGNIEIFREEIARVLSKNERGLEIRREYIKIRYLCKWMSTSYNQATGKDLLRVKLSFYLMRMKVLVIKKGIKKAQVCIIEPCESVWLEVLWLRAKHAYIPNSNCADDLQSSTKAWFFKFIPQKISNALSLITSSHHKSLHYIFFYFRKRLLEIEQTKTRCLYSQLMKIKEKSISEIKKEINKQAICRILPFFEKYNKLWIQNQRIFLLKWKIFSEKLENVYLHKTVYEIYMNLSELMHKEHKFKAECKIYQEAMRSKVYESSKLLDKILL